MIALAGLALAAAASAFAPPLGIPIRFDKTETRTLDGNELHFSLSARIVFTSDGDGFDAAMTFGQASDNAGGDISEMFQAAIGRLAGQTIRFRLDPTGAVTAIENRDAIWDALCTAMRRVGDTPDLNKRARAAADALSALPSDKRQALLGSMLAPVIAGPAGALTPASDAPVTLSARASDGSPVALAGQQTVSRNQNGDLFVSIHAAGDVGTPPLAPVHVDIARTIDIDPRTGLVIQRSETTASTTGKSSNIVESTSTLTVPVS